MVKWAPIALQIKPAPDHTGSLSMNRIAFYTQSLCALTPGPLPLRILVSRFGKFSLLLQCFGVFGFLIFSVSWGYWINFYLPLPGKSQTDFWNLGNFMLESNNLFTWSGVLWTLSRNCPGLRFLWGAAELCVWKTGLRTSCGANFTRKVTIYLNFVSIAHSSVIN